MTLLAIGAVLALTVAGCGGDNPSATEPAPSETTPASTQSASPEPSAEATAPKPTAPDTTAPARVPDSLNFTTTTVDGKPFKGASLAGKPTVMWFWAAWCPKCRGAAPAYKRAAEQYGGINLVGVAGKSDNRSMRDFISDYDLGDITHLAGKNDPLWTKYGITYQHQYVIIDKAGKIVHTGELSDQELTDRLDKLAG